MNLSALTALSPLDGRYAAKLAALRPLLSEYGLMHRRVQVEVEWFIALSDAGFAEFKPLAEASRGYLRSLVLRFSEADAQAIKDIERTTNHDVKAVEYWLKSRFENSPELKAAAEFGIASWAQFFLKWVLGHPAVTCVIPGTRRAAPLLDHARAPAVRPVERGRSGPCAWRRWQDRCLVSRSAGRPHAGAQA